VRKCLRHDEGMDCECTCDPERKEQREYDEWIDHLIDVERERDD
jgi:hypothetical protein